MDALREFLAERIEDRVFPGSAYAVGSRDEVRLGYAGRHKYSPDALPVGPETMWDLASLSKVLGTTCIAMALADRGILDIDRPIGEALTVLKGTWKSKLTARNLLLHNSGLPSYCTTTKAKSAEQALAIVMSQEKAYETGTKSEYSCVGFVTLQQLIERLTGKSLRILHRELVQRPLDMHHTDYTPDLARRPQCAPTSTIDDWRRQTEDERGFKRVDEQHIQGGVHDPIAFMIGGVSGNAGLFSTADDLGKLVSALLRGGEPIVRPATLREWTKTQSGTRALGWDTKSAEGSSAGSLFSMASYGHTGYTGTSIWIDPEQGIFSVWLTNRVHPDDSASLADHRPAWHDAVARELRNPHSGGTDHP